MPQRVLFLLAFILSACAQAPRPAVVFQSDFGLKNNAVAAMYGVAKGVDPSLPLYNLSHDIPSYDIWAGALNLSGVIGYWPKGTVFVSVIDPGVGTQRPSVVAKTATGHYIVTPDNGTLTFAAQQHGIEAVRTIDEAVNRRADSEKSYTFHGRDVYAYTAARLAAGKISFEQVGPLAPDSPHLLAYTKAQKAGENLFKGSIILIDEPYGNIWSDIPRDLFVSEGIQIGDRITVSIKNKGVPVLRQTMPYVETFGKVAENMPLLYINSDYSVALALNMGDFARTHGLEYGEGWTLEVSKEK